MMPGFFKDIPPRKGGKWAAIIIVRSSYFTQREVYYKEVTGSRKAYFLARIMALWEALWWPNDLGINWQIQRAYN